MARLILIVLLFALHLSAFAQSAALVIDSDRQHWIDRLDIRYGYKNHLLFTAVKPYERQELVQFIEELEQDTSLTFSNVDRWNMQYFKTDSWEFVKDTTFGQSKKTVGHTFYQRKADLYSHHTKAFDLHVNPVLNLSVGREFKEGRTLFLNTRGVEVRGIIDGKVGFYTFIADNQVRFPNYVDNYIYRGGTSAVPGENHWKVFKDNGYDFFTARGYITFNFTKHINLRFGQDKNFFGNGYRSFILSDHAGSYPFIKIQTKVWKLKYTNLFSDMISGLATDAGGNLVDGRYPRKFVTMHHLSVDLSKNFNLGFFETIIYSRGDSSLYPAYDINYFNPVIFYRSVEQNLGSSDNALLGIDFKWNLWRRVSLYGQLALDEFNLDELKNNKGYWGNKYAVQAGFKYIDVFGAEGLDFQGEFNMSRPYMHQHVLKSSGYTHFQQPLAHPLGANFYELIAIARWQPSQKLFLTGKMIYDIVGYDTSAVNYGQNLLLPYTSRASENDNTIAQGAQSNLLFLDFTMSFMLKHNLFLDLKTVLRNETNDWAALSQETAFTQLGLRWNIGQRLTEF